MSTFPPILIVISLVLIHEQGMACECRNKELHNLYCEADFVVIGRISSTMRIDISRPTVFKFEVNIRRILRDINGIIIGKVTMNTPRTYKLCRAKLKRKHTYILGGRKFRNDFYITTCDLVKEWKELTHFQRSSITKGRLSCKCVIRPCGSDVCTVRRPGELHYKVCSIQKEHKCYDDYGVCIYKDNRCKWSKRSRQHLSKCLDNGRVNTQGNER